MTIIKSVSWLHFLALYTSDKFSLAKNKSMLIPVENKVSNWISIQNSHFLVIFINIPKKNKSKTEFFLSLFYVRWRRSKKKDSEVSILGYASAILEEDCGAESKKVGAPVVGSHLG